MHYKDEGLSSITAYLGNLQIKPVSRVWNTYKLDRDYSHAEHKAPSVHEMKPRSVLLRKKEKKQKKRPFILDYVKLSSMEYNIEEKVEEKIAKHALLEALFQTQLWMEPYVTNPFIYVTDYDSDFDGERGKAFKDYMKKVFYH